MSDKFDYGRRLAEKSKPFLYGSRVSQRRHKEVGDVDGLGGLVLRAEIGTQNGFTSDKVLLDGMVGVGMDDSFAHTGKKMGLVSVRALGTRK